MTMQATSLQSYEEIKKTLGLRQLIVLQSLDYSARALTNTELSKILIWPINTVTPRIWELRKKGLVKEHEKRKCAVTGRMAIAWRIRRPDEIEHQEDFFRG